MPNLRGVPQARNAVGVFGVRVDPSREKQLDISFVAPPGAENELLLLEGDLAFRKLFARLLRRDRRLAAGGNR
jgi:hypothetical protein